MPLLARLLSRITNPNDPSHTKGLSGPYSLGRWGLPLNLLGVLFLLFNSIIFNLPTISPVNSENMNYTCAAVGGIMLLSLITWLWTGKKHFTGPEAGNVIQAVEGVQRIDAPAVGYDDEKLKEKGN